MPPSDKKNHKLAHANLQWIASLDAVIADFKRICESNSSSRFMIDSPKPRGATPDQLNVRSDRDNLREAYLTLLKARTQLDDAVGILALSNHISAHERFLYSNSILENDNKCTRDMRLEGKQGWARLVENGGFIGPAIGAQLAAIIRGEKKFRQGQSSSAEDERERLFAVKRVATIEHLFSVRTATAIIMYCEHYYPDDPNDSKNGTVTSWVKRQRERANGCLKDPDASERDLKSARKILNGLCSDQPKGVHFGKSVSQLDPFLNTIRK
jgi:hypothetical protein